MYNRVRGKIKNSFTVPLKREMIVKFCSIFDLFSILPHVISLYSETKHTKYLSME